ncbi:hypothetical protein FPOA_09019 [Fusarium poae]|uniref:Nephrocystin 3-like N-terminal domain-containing protein n=1 Tax=Fusarium poae TaxID=36050 RepID=A0A1B8AQC0_FUSPO|nr:hypothetical protein FPOA_09019 [Fusarium poae]
MENCLQRDSQTTPVSPAEVSEKPRKFGLTQVYPDPKDVTATEEKEIDIFVLHGLDARCDKTFIAWKVDGDKTSGDVHWLSDTNMLPMQVPEARILTYDWNADYDKLEIPIIFIASCFGGVLLSAALVGALESQHHWFKRRRQIYDSCVGLAFLGTPFRGSWDTGTEVARLRIEAARRADPDKNIQYSMELVQYLKEGTRDVPSPLDDLMRRFQESMKNPKFRIPEVSLYETQPAQNAGPLSRLSLEDRENQTTIDRNGQGIVVSQRSATLGGGDRSAQPMRHNMMHKYNSPDNPAFQSLCVRLKDFVKDAEATIESRNRERLNEMQAPTRNEIQPWLERLSFPNMNHRYLELKQTMLTPGTCEWLFTHEKYLAWECNDCEDPILLIEGKAGSGKSTLMYKAVSRAEAMHQDSKSICLSYFFDAAKGEGSPTQIASQGLYRSLLYQMLEKINLSSDVMALVREWIPSTDKVDDVVVLRDRISRLLATIRGRTVRLFIDAIDECGKGQDGGMDDAVDMLEYIQGLQGNESQVLVLFSIRDRAQYGSCLSGPAIDIGQHNQRDISIFLSDNLAYSQDSIVRQQIIRTLLRRSSNVFLWAKLVVKNLNLKTEAGLTNEELRQEVERLPKRLESLYEDLLDRLIPQYRSDALTLLRLVQVRMRPLDVLEMRSAMEIATHSYDSSPERIRSEEAFEAHIQNICRGFIEIQVSEDPYSIPHSWDIVGAQLGQDHDELCEMPEEDEWTPPPPRRLVQFTHESVRDFLDKHVGGEVDITSCANSSAPYAHFEVSKLCMKTVGDAKKDAPFFGYASHFWTIHARYANETIDGNYQPLDFVTKCSWKTKGIISRYKEHANEPYSLYHLKTTDISNTVWLDDKATMLMLLAFEGCGALITKHSDCCTRKDCCEDESTIRDAFALALLRGWKAAVLAVLDLAQRRSIQLDPTINPHFTNGICPLQRCCSRNQYEILESILNIGWDTRNSAARVSFCEGVLRGHTRIVKLFLESAEDSGVELLSWQSAQGYTALHFAAFAGRWRIFEMLLDSLGDAQPDLLDVRSIKGETVLDMAERGKRKHEMRRDSEQIVETIREILD